MCSASKLAIHDCAYTIGIAIKPGRSHRRAYLTTHLGNNCCIRLVDLLFHLTVFLYLKPVFLQSTFSRSLCYVFVRSSLRHPAFPLGRLSLCYSELLSIGRPELRYLCAVYFYLPGSLQGSIQNYLFCLLPPSGSFDIVLVATLGSSLCLARDAHTQYQ